MRSLRFRLFMLLSFVFPALATAAVVSCDVKTEHRCTTYEGPYVNTKTCGSYASLVDSCPSTDLHGTCMYAATSSSAKTTTYYYHRNGAPIANRVVEKKNCLTDRVLGVWTDYGIDLNGSKEKKAADKKADVKDTEKKKSKGAGQDAKNCVVWDTVSAAKASFGSASQRMTNTCSYDIHMFYCHGPSSQNGTKGTECGSGGRYYQQFPNLKAGASGDNHFAMPTDAKMYWGACKGKGGSQTTNGGYTCK